MVGLLYERFFQGFFDRISARVLYNDSLEVFRFVLALCADTRNCKIIITHIQTAWTDGYYFQHVVTPVI